MVAKPTAIDSLRLIMNEIDQVSAPFASLIRVIESSEQRLNQLRGTDVLNQNPFQEPMSTLSNKRVSELMRGMASLLELVPPESAPPITKQIEDLKATLRTLETASTHLHNALDGV